MIHKMRNTHSKMLWRRRQHCIYSPFIVVVVVVAKPAAPSSAAHLTADDSPTTKRKTKTVCSISWSVCDEVLAAHLTWDRKTADAKPHRITTKLCALRTHTHCSRPKIIKLYDGVASVAAVLLKSIWIHDVSKWDAVADACPSLLSLSLSPTASTSLS